MLDYIRKLFKPRPAPHRPEFETIDPSLYKWDYCPLCKDQREFKRGVGHFGDVERCLCCGFMRCYSDLKLGCEACKGEGER